MILKRKIEEWIVEIFESVMGQDKLEIQKL